MLLRSISFAVLFSLMAVVQANAGIGLHYSGRPVPNNGQNFNFAVSSTNPNSMEPSDSPTEPTSPFFSNFVQLRVYTVSLGAGRTPMMGGGGGGFPRGGQAAGGFGGVGGPVGGIQGKQFAMFGKGMGGGAGAGGAGGFGGGAIGGGIGGAGTTSTDQTVSGTGGIVCVTDTGTTDPGTGPDGGDGGAGSGGGGGQPSPSAVPEPGSMALWTLMTGMLIFGTRRFAS